MLESMMSGEGPGLQGIINQITGLVILTPVRKGVINQVTGLMVYTPTRKGVINQVTGIAIVKELIK